MFSQSLTNKGILISIFCFALLFTSFSQELKRKSLKKIILDLQEKFEVSFSYQDSDITELDAFPPNEDKSLKESLDFLSIQTGLDFQQLDGQFIAIVKPKTLQQTVCGFIVAADKTVPLVNATIESGQIATVSDQDGFFAIKDLPEEALISVQYLGYETLYLTRSSLTEGCKTIVMTPSIASLPEVTIYNYFTKGIDRTTDGKLVIHPKNQQLLPGMTEPDVLFTIQTLPGIQSVDETVSNLNIRGGTNDQNLVLWEGIRMYQTGHFFGLISAFNPYFNDQVRITTNGTPARYGHATTGTIELHSNDEIPTEMSGSAGLGLNMINGDLNMKIPLTPKTGLKFSARRAITDLIQTPTFDKYFDRAFENTEVLGSSPSGATSSDHLFRFYDISSRLNHRFSEDHHLSLSFLAISNRLEFEELQGAVSRNSTLDQQSVAVGVNHHKKWNPRLSTLISSSLSSYQLDALNFDIPNDQRLIQKNQVVNYNLRALANLRLNDVDLEMGLETDEIGVENLDDINNPDFSRVIKEVVSSYSGFVQGAFKRGKSELVLGTRVIHYEDLRQFMTEPRLSFSHKITPELSFELLGELKSQAITQVIDLQTDFLGVEKRRWVLSNEQDLPIQTSKNVSIGFQYKKQDFLFSTSGYVREVNGITSSGQGFLNQFRLIRESGSYRVRGLEFLLTYSFQDFTAWLNTSLLQNTYRFPAFIPKEFPSNLDIRNSTSLGLSYDRGPFELSIGMNSRSGRPFTLVNTDDPISNDGINYESPNSSRLDNYLRVDFSANYKFQLSEDVAGHLGLSFWNISNQDNFLNQYYQVQDDEVLMLRQRALAFTPNLIFRITF